MSDGGPNGYSILNFNKDGYQLDYKAAGARASEQMRVTVPANIAANKTKGQDVWVNVYSGSEKSTVEMSIDGGDWSTLTKELKRDPFYIQIAKRDVGTLPKPARPRVCHHLWRGKLTTQLEPGAHLIRVKTTDRHGRIFHAHRSVRVSASEDSEQSKSEAGD